MLPDYRDHVSHLLKGLVIASVKKYHNLSLT